MAEPETSSADKTSGSKSAFDLVVDKATDRFYWWQQLPAWVLGLAAIAGGGFLIAFPKHLTADQARSAWAAIIVALFLAVLLSYRSAFTLSDDGKGAGGDSDAAKQADGQSDGVTPAPKG
jgi:hypothetical protein